LAIFLCLAPLSLFAASIVGVSAQVIGNQVNIYAEYNDHSQQKILTIPTDQFYGLYYLGNGIIEYIDKQNINPANNPQAESSFYDINTHQSASGLSPVLATDANHKLVALGGYGSNSIDVGVIFNNCSYLQNISLSNQETYSISNGAYFDKTGNLKVPFKTSEGKIWKTFPIDFNQFIEKCHCQKDSC
jgi:hypothetical protein